MSVPKPERNQSEMEFLYTARKLLEMTLRKCKKIPKRFTFLLTTRVTNTAWSIYDSVKAGNSIYPSNQHEVQTRRDHFLHAKAQLYVLVSEIEVVAEFIPISGDDLKGWMALVRTEINLLKGVLDADNRRYKNLP